MEYIAYLHKDKGSDFGVSFPDFPGCITVGSTLEEARRHAVDALATAIAGMVEDGDPIPNPSSLDDLTSDPDMAGAVAVLIAAETPDPTVRFNITARESQLAAIDRVSKEAGMSRSAYLVYAALRPEAKRTIVYKRAQISGNGHTFGSEVSFALRPNTLGEVNDKSAFGVLTSPPNLPSGLYVVTCDPDDKELIAMHSAGRWRLVEKDLNCDVGSTSQHVAASVVARGVNTVIGVASLNPEIQNRLVGDFVVPQDPGPTSSDMPKRRR